MYHVVWIAAALYRPDRTFDLYMIRTLQLCRIFEACVAFSGKPHGVLSYIKPRYTVRRYIVSYICPAIVPEL